MQNDKPVTLRANARVVEVDVSVRDSQGKSVGTFTNIGEPPPSREGHSTVILLDGINGWFDNFAYARQGVLGMLSKAPADEKIALYVISKGEGLLMLQDYTLDRARLLEAMTKYIPHAMCQAPP